MSKSVVGLGFGDEGKGLTVNFLAKQRINSLVVRHSGGQQAGHTVVDNGIRHVFSNFGSGSLNGHPTYWSKYCTIDPIGIVNEFEALENKGVTPRLYIDAKCPVTTPLEKMIQGTDAMMHGTCGVGVGQTLQREEEFHSILFEDLFYPSVLTLKLSLLMKKYEVNYLHWEEFDYCVDKLIKNENIILTHGFPSNLYGMTYSDVIFESSQGLLLDQHYGFFPHVTRSNTGTKNILEMEFEPEMFLVTRAYQTRHGNGPMTNELIPHQFQLNPRETNVTNKFQGKFRVSVLDLDLLEYGINKDPYINGHRNNLIITCLDQIENFRRFTYKGELSKQYETKEDFASKICSILHCSHLYISDSDDSKLTQLY